MNDETDIVARLRDNSGRHINGLYDRQAADEIETLRQQLAALKPQASVPSAEPPFDMLAHLKRQAEFSAKTFGPGARVEGVTDHIAKELREVRESGGDLSEWVDVIILAFDGAWRSGASPAQIIDAMVAKQTKNEGRKWPDWRAAPAGKAIEHDRSGEVGPTPLSATATKAQADTTPSVAGLAGPRTLTEAQIERDVIEYMASWLEVYAHKPASTASTAGAAAMKLSDLPAIGQPLDAGLFAGLTTKPDGTHCAVVLLADKPAEGVTWKQAMAWAKKLEAELPARPVSALLFANLKAQFDPAWHWNCESYDSSCAWCQNFDDGTQSYDGKSYAGRARAVRLIQLTA